MFIEFYNYIRNERGDEGVGGDVMRLVVLICQKKMGVCLVIGHNSQRSCKYLRERQRSSPGKVLDVSLHTRRGEGGSVHSIPT